MQTPATQNLATTMKAEHRLRIETFNALYAFSQSDKALTLLPGKSFFQGFKQPRSGCVSESRAKGPRALTHYSAIFFFKSENAVTVYLVDLLPQDLEQSGPGGVCPVHHCLHLWKNTNVRAFCPTLVPVRTTANHHMV